MIQRFQWSLPLAVWVCASLFIALPKIVFAAELLQFVDRFPDEMLPRQGAQDDSLGVNARSGNFLLANSSGINGSGAGYFFERTSDGGYRFVQRVAPSPDFFSFSRAAMQGDTVVVGGPGVSRFDLLEGVAWVYERDAATGQWELIQTLRGSETDGNEVFLFGGSVALDGSTLLVGVDFVCTNGCTTGDDDQIGGGAVFFFERQPDGRFVETQKILSPSGQPLDGFGSEVTLAGDTALIGAPKEDMNGIENVGATYVFERDSGGVWRQQQRLIASDAGENSIGFSVRALDGDRALMTGGGKAYIFERDVSGQWSERAIFRPEPGDFPDIVSFGLAKLKGDTAVLTSIGVAVPGVSLPELFGLAWLYQRDPDTGAWRLRQILTVPDPEQVSQGNLGGGLIFDDAGVLISAAQATVNGAINTGAIYDLKFVDGPAVDLQTSLSASAAQVQSGDTVDYTVHVLNADESVTATNVAVSAGGYFPADGVSTLQLGMDNELVSADNGCSVETPDANPPVIRCQVGDLAPGASADVHYTLRHHTERFDQEFGGGQTFRFWQVVSTQSTQPDRDMRTNNAGVEVRVKSNAPPPPPPPPQPPPPGGGGGGALTWSLLAGLLAMAGLRTVRRRSSTPPDRF